MSCTSARVEGFKCDTSQKSDSRERDLSIVKIFVLLLLLLLLLLLYYGTCLHSIMCQMSSVWSIPLKHKSNKRENCFSFIFNELKIDK